ncbi:FecR domain-containing protein [uncultured Alistipes sp.]|uniref:FecR family protein n=1 Tax=uncultured Alistipes sp. TaxID=538949 RepID=UPI0032092A25
MTTPEEETQIAEWLSADPNNQKEMDTARFLFDTVKLYGDKIQPTQRRPLVRWRTIGRWAAQIAAAVMIAVGAGFFANRYSIGELSDKHHSIYVPAGQRMELTLADGTRVWMNSESRLEYPIMFAQDVRHVKLIGEAMFEVAHDKSHPFIVETFASDVRVLGTKFSVDANEAHHRFSITLMEGSVRISNRLDPSQANIVMRPNEKVDLIGNYLYTSKLDDYDAPCWMNGQLDITGLSFTELMEKMEQAFAVRVVIKCSSLPSTAGIGGKIRINAGVGNAFKWLHSLLNFDYEIDEAENTITIK